MQLQKIIGENFRAIYTIVCCELTFTHAKKASTKQTCVLYTYFHQQMMEHPFACRNAQHLCSSLRAHIEMKCEAVEIDLLDRLLIK